MKPTLSITLLILFTFLLLAAASWHYLFSKIIASPQAGPTSFSNNDSLRTHAINDIASKLSFLKSNQTITLDSLPEEWVQIGTATQECELISRHCSISSPSCFNMSALADGKFTVPSDILQGTPDKTGFALRKVGKTLEIVACYTDQEDVISQQLRF